MPTGPLWEAAMKGDVEVSIVARNTNALVLILTQTHTLKLSRTRSLTHSLTHYLTHSLTRSHAH